MNKKHKRICDLSDNDIIILVNEYKDEDVSISELARRHNMCKATIGYIFKRLGVVIRRRRTEEEWSRLAGRIVSAEK